MGLELHFHSPVFEYNTGTTASAPSDGVEGEEMAVDDEEAGGPSGAGIGAIVALIVLVVIAFVARKKLGGDADDEFDAALD